MIDWSRWLPGVKQDEDEDPVSKTLRTLQQGASDVGAGISSAASSAGEALGSAAQTASSYLPQLPSVLPEPVDPTRFAQPRLAEGQPSMLEQLPAVGAEYTRAATEALGDRGALLAGMRPPETPEEVVAAGAPAPFRAARIASEVGSSAMGAALGEYGERAAGTEPSFRTAEIPTPLGTIPSVAGPTPRQIGSAIGSVVGDPTNLILPGTAADRAASLAIEQGAGALRGAAGRAAGSAAERITGALGRNAENVAAADARMAAEGGTSLPGTLGVISENPLEAGRAARTRIVPPEVADTLDYPLNPPTDPALIRAIEAHGGTVDERGATMHLIRNQGPEAAGGTATRGMTYHIAGEPGAPNPYASSGKSSTGGSVRIEGGTRYRNPLFISQEGGKGYLDDALEQLGVQAPPDPREIARLQGNVEDLRAAVAEARQSGDRYSVQANEDDLRWYEKQLEAAKVPQPVRGRNEIDDAIDEIRRQTPKDSAERTAALQELTARYGGDPSVVPDLVALRPDKNESGYAIIENIIGAHARKRGHDGVVYVGRGTPDFGAVNQHPAVVAAGDALRQANAAERAAHQQVDLWASRLRQHGQGARDAADEGWAHLRRLAEDEGRRTPVEAQWVAENTAARAEQRARDAAEELRAAEKQAHAELTPRTIEEVADPREARNPTPGALDTDGIAARNAEIESMRESWAKVTQRIGDFRPDDTLETWLARQAPDVRQEAARIQQRSNDLRAEIGQLEKGLGPEHPEVIAARGRRDALTSEQRALQQRIYDGLDRWQTEHPGQDSRIFLEGTEGVALSDRMAEADGRTRAAQRTLEATQRRYPQPSTRGPQGYTLREDIPRRERSFAELERAYKTAMQRWKTSPTEAAGNAAYAEMEALRLPLRDALARERGTPAGGTVGALPAARGAGALSAVNRALGEGIAGGVGGAVIEQGRNPDEDPRTAAARGFAVGAVGFPAATRLARGAARLAGAAEAGDGTRLASALGNVPDEAAVARRRARIAARGPLPELPEGALPIKATPEAEVGRLRLDLFPPDARADIQAAAEGTDFARTQRRGVLPDAAVSRLADDDAHSVDQLIKNGKMGRAYNPEETVAIRNAVASQADIVRSLSQQIAEASAGGATPDLLIARRAAESTKLQGLVQVAEGARAEAGRTLRQYAQQARLIELDPNAAISRIRAKIKDPDEFAAIVDEYTRAVNDGADPIVMAKLWSKVERGEIKAGDVFALYRRFNMLSGPRTFEVNALSGGLNLGYELLGQAAQQGARGRLGEAAAELGAPFKAGARAFQNMAETMWHGVSAEQAARGDIPRNLSARTDNPLAKAALTTMEIPDRLNAGVDQFFRTMTEDWAATILAHKQARAGGLSPRSAGWAEAVADNLAKIREDPSAFPDVKAMADRVTFSEEPGGLVKGLEDLKRRSPNLVGFVAPFIRTPANIASRAVDISPLGPVRTAVEAATGLGRGRANLSQRVRDNVIGTAATAWAYSQAQQGNLTGAGPDDPEKLAELRATGWQPYSIKIGDQYWSYANFAPFSLALSAGAAASEAQQYAKPGKGDVASMLADGAVRTGKVVTDMTVLAGLGAVIKAQQDPARYGTQWLTTALSQLMPAGSLVNTVGQATDPLVRRSERTDVGTQVVQNLEARVPGLRETVPAAQDPLGRDIESEQTGLRALNPFRPTTGRDEPVLREFLAANVDIGKPREDLTISRYGADGRVVESIPMPLTAAEQRRWNTLRGEALVNLAGRVGSDPGWRSVPAADKERYLRQQLETANDYATRTVRGEIGDDEITRRISSRRRAG